MADQKFRSSKKLVKYGQAVEAVDALETRNGDSTEEKELDKRVNQLSQIQAVGFVVIRDKDEFGHLDHFVSNYNGDPRAIIKDGLPQRQHDKLIEAANKKDIKLFKDAEAAANGDFLRLPNDNDQ